MLTTDGEFLVNNIVEFIIISVIAGEKTIHSFDHENVELYIITFSKYYISITITI